VSPPLPGPATRQLPGTTKQGPGEPYSWPGGPANRTSDPSTPSRRAQHARDTDPAASACIERAVPAGQPAPGPPTIAEAGPLVVLPGLPCAPADVERERRAGHRASYRLVDAQNAPFRSGIDGHGHGASQRAERRFAFALRSRCVTAGCSGSAAAGSSVRRLRSSGGAFPAGAPVTGRRCDVGGDDVSGVPVQPPRRPRPGTLVRRCARRWPSRSPGRCAARAGW
jgi:hypothetical protein